MGGGVGGGGTGTCLDIVATRARRCPICSRPNVDVETERAFDHNVSHPICDPDGCCALERARSTALVVLMCCPLLPWRCHGRVCNATQVTSCAPRNCFGEGGLGFGSRRSVETTSRRSLEDPKDAACLVCAGVGVWSWQVGRCTSSPM